MRHFIVRTFIPVVFLCGTILLGNSAYSSSEQPDLPAGLNPKAVAINRSTDQAIVVNDKSNSVSVVDLNSQTVVATIPVGNAPGGIALDEDANVALVSNIKDNTISVIDLDILSVVKTIPVGKEPGGIAINELTRMAAVVNHKDDTVSFIDLVNYRVEGTIMVSNKPRDVAMDPSLNLAFVTGENAQGISVIDLVTTQVSGTIPVERKPGAIDVDRERHRAAVLHREDKSMTIVDLITLQTRTMSLGRHPTEVAINPLDGGLLVICDGDRSLLLIDPEEVRILHSYTTHKKPQGLAVNSFTNVAAVTDEETDGVTLIALPNPVPKITSLSPDMVARGHDGITVEIKGERFTKGAEASIRAGTVDYVLSVTFIDNHRLSAMIPPERLLQAGISGIVVSNGLPEGGTSDSMEFTIANPVPFISALEPAEAVLGTQGLSITLFGSGFFGDTVTYFGGIPKTTTYGSSFRLQMDLTSEDIKAAGKYEVTAYNPPPGGGSSNRIVFTAKNPLEVKISSPTDGQSFNRGKIMIRGTFRSGSKDVGVTVNGIVAEMRGNEWAANDVPLAQGANIVKAVIKDGAGDSAEAAVNVNVSDLLQSVRLSANMTSGIAPLTVYFSISTELSSAVVTYRIDFEGDGIFDYEGTTFENISHTYTSEGIYFPTATVTDNMGNTHSDTIAVIVLNKTEMDTLLRTKWEEMKENLSRKDVTAALSYFLDASRENYREAFNIIVDDLPQIVTDMRDIEMVYLKGAVGKYRIKREHDIDGVLQTLSYYIYFSKSNDGIWKIDRF